MTMRWTIALAMALMTAITAAQDLPAPAAEAAPEAPPSPLKTPNEKNSYALGASLGATVRQLALQLDSDFVMLGFKDALSGGKTLLTAEEARATVVQMQNEQKAKAMLEARAIAEKNKKDGEAFLAVNNTKKGIFTLPSGLQYKIVTTGKGRTPKLQDEVVCHYRGTLIDGTEFDSSYSRHQPATFAVSGVIKGWTEALQLMPVGSKWQLFIPPNLAYGDRGSGRIGPDATLIFEVELVAIKGK